MSTVPHRDVVGNSGKEASFSNAEEETRDEEAVIGLHYSHECHYYSPGDHFKKLVLGFQHMERAEEDETSSEAPNTAKFKRRNKEKA